MRLKAFASYRSSWQFAGPGDLFKSLVGKHKPSLEARIGLAALYGVAAVPFFYWMDRVAFRRYQKLRGGAPARDPKRKR